MLNEAIKLPLSGETISMLRKRQAELKDLAPYLNLNDQSNNLDLNDPKLQVSTNHVSNSINNERTDDEKKIARKRTAPCSTSW